MLSLILAAIFFSGIHLGIAGTTLRDRAVAALGQNAYRAIFSLASVAGIVWLALAYKYAPYVVTWGVPEWWKPVAIILMLPAFILAVAGLGTPNPTAVGMEGLAAHSPEGIVRVTRHPLLMGIGLWALIHLIANGDVASFLFFGALSMTALAGTVSIDAKRRRALGPAWQGFVAQTSVIPFAAIAAGRTRFNPREIAAWRWAVAIAAYALILGGHSHIFGVSPFPG
ncbi:MAG TPA: NnrU family protein [Methylocella sp.]|nr:NnrU family protein [Methylocella sp.]